MNLLLSRDGRRRVKNAVGRAKGYGWCYRCEDTWDRVEGHSTPYGNGRGCFPLCESCWAALTPEERVPYYDMLWVKWTLDLASLPSQLLSDEVTESYSEEVYDSIITAVRSGL